MVRRYISGCLVGLGVVALVAACSSGDDPLLEDVDSVEEGAKKPRGTNGDGDYCNNPAALCVSGEGDCDYAYQCTAGLTCVSNNGPKFLMPVGHDVCAPAHCANGVLDGNETVADCGGSCSAPSFNCGDVCQPHRTAYPNGHPSHCTTACPCPAGEGDCDAHSDCNAGLVCGSNNGDKFGAPSGDDYCVPSTCVNGALDPGETTPDCGGSCGSCGQFVGLGDLPGGVFSSAARAVSQDGSVIVGYSTSANGTEAFRWTLSTGIQPLGDVTGGTFESFAYGVSNTGAVVVGRGTSAAGTVPFRWTSTGIALLGDLPGGSARGEAYGVSGDGGTVVGWSGSTNGTEAFRYAGSMVALGDLPGGLFNSQAWAANSNGTVIVGRGTSASGQEAFRWTSGGMVGLGDLAGGAFASLATAVSSSGSVVVGNGTTASGVEAFRWTSSTGMRGIGVPAGTTSSYAYGVNSAGNRIVGTATTDGTDNVAFLWSSSGGMQSLESILIAQGSGAALTGWTLQLATAISSDGTWIVGFGLNPSGNTEAFRARIP